MWYFLGQLNATLGKKIERVTAPTMDRLITYAWPGNARELRNVLERAIILSPGPVLLLDQLGDDTRTPPPASMEAADAWTLADVQRDHIRRILESCHGRVRGLGSAAEQLGLNASTLYSRMKKLGIRPASSSPRRDAHG